LDDSMARLRILGIRVALGALGLIAGGLVVSATLVATTDSAQALPIFARQTGQPCGNCHTDFLGLTPFGRRFKLGGYTLGGGPFRTPLFSEPKGGKIFPTVDDFKSVLVPGAASANASAEGALRSYAAEKTPGSRAAINDSFAAVKQSSDTDKGWVPPLSVMLIAGYTHTQAPDPGLTPGSPWKANDNVGLAQASLFGGGAALGAGTMSTSGMPIRHRSAISTFSTVSQRITIRLSKMSGTPLRRGQFLTLRRNSVLPDQAQRRSLTRS
jgi:hypothetical protein